MSGTRIGGTMLRPGVSKNGRLYTPENIQAAYKRLSERLKNPGRPATMLTHHGAGDDSRLIVGRLTSVTLNGTNMDYTGELAPTPEASTIEQLLGPEGDPAFLSNVSIRGWWIGEVKQVNGCETGDDMEIDGLDFTKSPGVEGATVHIIGDGTDTTETLIPAGVTLITESVEARLFTEHVAEAKVAVYGTGPWADPGYQDDNQKRYPLDTKTRAKAAWSYINQKDNAARYTAAQLKRIKGRIKTALKKFGVDVTAESLETIAATAPEEHMLTESDTTLSECSSCYDDYARSGFSISAYNGPLVVTVAAYNGVEPEDLEGVAMAAMKAAIDAVHVMDPDVDGDIDTGTASEGNQPDDNQMEAAPAAATVEEGAMEPTTDPAGAPAEGTTTEPAAAEPVDEPTEGAEGNEDTDTDGVEGTEDGAEGTEGAPTETAPAAEPVTETTAPAAIDEAALRESIRAEVIAEERGKLKTEVIREAMAAGLITRKGLVQTLGENSDTATTKQLHEMTDDEVRAYAAERADLFFAHNPQ